jgi:hypothetical protein
MHMRSFIVAVVAALSVAVWSGQAMAQAENNEPSDTMNGVKGAIGLGLLGADVTLIIEGACRVRNPWLLSIIPIVVAGGGAAGGYFVGAGSLDTEGDGSLAGGVALLVSGLALIIPAAILVAHGRSYRRERDDEGFVDRTEEGMPLGDEEGSEPDADGAAQTEVVGPEEGSDEGTTDEQEPAPAEEPAPAPVEDGGAAAPAPGATASAFHLLSSTHLAGRLPVGGVLQLVAEHQSAAGAPMLSLRYF